MLLLPERLRKAAMELLARLRVGLDIPSRAELLELATRIEAISAQMGRLEERSQRDRELVEVLRRGAKESRSESKRSKPLKASSRGDRKKQSPKKTKASAASDKKMPAGKVAAHSIASSDAPTTSKKRKPESRKDFGS